jgi:putative inorganic carbon (hco3(-)) transporter
MRNLQQLHFLFIGFIILLVSLYYPTSTTAYVVIALFVSYAIWKPKNGLLLVLLYFPIRAMLIEVNPTLKLLGDLVIIAIFLRTIFDHRKHVRSLFQFHYFEIAFFLFCLVGAMSAYLTGVSLIAIIFQLRAFLITYILFYVVKRMEISKDDVRKFLATAIFVAVVLAVQGIIEKMSLRTLLMPESWVNLKLMPTNRFRVYGMIGNPNALGMFSGIAIFAGLLFRNVVKNSISKWALNGFIVVAVGLLTLTYSRGSILGIAFGFIAYLLITRNWKLLKVSIIASIAAVLFVYYPVTTFTGVLEKAENRTELDASKAPKPAKQKEDKEKDKDKEDKAEDNDKNTDSKDVNEKNEDDFGERLKETFDKKTLNMSYQDGRLYVITKGFEIFKDSPVIGTGFSTYGDSAVKSYGSPIYEDYGIAIKTLYSDNQYIQIIVQTGIVGVILFAIFLLGMLHTMWKHRKEVPFALPLMAFLLSGFVWALFYNTWEDKTFTSYFFIMFGYFMHKVQQKKQLSK